MDTPSCRVTSRRACLHRASGIHSGGKDSLRSALDERLLRIGQHLHNHQNIAAAAWLPSSYDRLIHAFDIAWPRLLSTVTDHGLASDTARRQLADVVLLFDGDGRTPAEIAEAALEKFGI
jgi:hypothetical protein